MTPDARIQCHCPVELGPCAHDWLVVGNGLRAMFGQPPLTDARGVPSYEELAAYDDVIAVGSERLRELAWREMRHRMKMGDRAGARTDGHVGDGDGA